ncbi:hypothetical protein PRIPAC_76667 [Pristionchus pacificus]|uniref:Uncharacterized protein n=1 Tax=Pristionchus pacificus TaxID=54126 RepID=A0A2A6C597_PRIPA|nr:hypothetical protein PRIPAC_76667 [Pristionchus pacificus]|eukprot:PDM73223.1 hypothetical protein PRIPAC_40579 [Pristionchus pacificus]
MWTYRVPGSSSSAPATVAPIVRLSLLLLALPTCGLARFPIEKWECGSEEFTKSWSHSEVITQCPHFAEEINHCCVVHDDCYGRGKGQKLCDEQFDVCNKKVLEDTRAEPCSTIIEIAFSIVSTFGESAYKASANYTEPPESSLPQLCRPEKTVGVFFDYLYLSCPTMKSQSHFKLKSRCVLVPPESISSCCDQLTVCPDLPLGRNRTECANRAMRCLAAARADEHHGFNDGHCDRALDRTRKYLALDYIMEGSGGAHGSPKGQHGLPPPTDLFANSNQAFVLLMVLSMMCGLCLLLVTYKYYRLRSQNNERKYSSITLSTA